MIVRRSGLIVGFLLLLPSLVLAGPATQPKAEAPTTAPASTQPAEATTRLPTPAELLAKIRALRAEAAATPKVAYFDLADPIAERPADFSFFGEQSTLTLRALVARLYEARDDDEVRAVLITLGDPGIGLAQAQEVRDALVELEKAGKRSFVYADSFDTTTYTLASGATDICMLDGGQIMIPGVGLEAMFAKGLLDKLGVQADYVQIGEYKGADEQFTRTAPTEQLRGELSKLTQALYGQIVDGFSRHRDLPADQVKRLIDDAMVHADRAHERGLVDHLVDMDGLRDLLKAELDDETIDLVHDYGAPQREEVDLSSPFALLSLLSKRPEVSDEPAIAVIYADGTIVDGKGSESLFGGGAVGSDDLREAFRIAARDENVKAVVIRIDSPGGSALASEAMWQAARRLAKEKPVVVSIGSMAASGGYYLASAGDTIYADPAAIIGSIGVVGGKFVTRELYDKLGLATESFNQGSNADLFSSTQAFTERQRELIRTWMTKTYDQFIERVLTTRTGKIKDIDQVARGRVFLAEQARALGMVDALGGMHEAIADAAAKADLDGNEYEIRVLPAPKTLADFFNGGAEAKLPFTPGVASASPLMQLLDPQARQLLGQQLQMLRLLQKRPVILAAPFTIRVR